MPSPKTQNYGNHRRYLPLYHYIAQPVLALNVIYAFQQLWLDPTKQTGWNAVVALALISGLVAARQMALIVQDRVIRIEMRARLREVLPPPLAMRIGELRVRQIVGLRFAGDAELPALVERCLAGELRTSGDVKKQVTDWQPDFLRA